MFPFGAIGSLFLPSYNSAPRVSQSVEVTVTQAQRKAAPKVSQPARPKVTYRRNAQGNLQIHCEQHKFPAFVFDPTKKAIVGVQHPDGVYALTEHQQGVCDEWGLAWAAPEPPAYSETSSDS